MKNTVKTISLKTLPLVLALCFGATDAMATYHDKQGKSAGIHSSLSAGTSGKLSSGNVASLQRSLSSQGYYNGSVDGVWGPQTSAAIKSYQRTNKMDANGSLTSSQLRGFGINADSDVDLNVDMDDKNRARARGDYSASRYDDRDSRYDDRKSRYDDRDSRWNDRDSRRDNRSSRYNDRDMNAGANADVDARANVDLRRDNAGNNLNR